MRLAPRPARSFGHLALPAARSRRGGAQARTAHQTDGAVAARIYGYFLAPGFRGSHKDLGRVVHETGESPDFVYALWHKFRIGAGSPEADEEAKEMERLAREYDEQIAAMDAELTRKRRAVFIPGDSGDDDAPPSSGPPSSR